jgi:hypothetical protein
VLAALIGGLTGWQQLSVVLLVFLVAMLILFSSLTIEIDRRQLRCFFGPGLIRRTIPLNAIVSELPVRNRWYHGWGVRLIPTGWMFNVSGLDAVELVLASGSRFRIGTDRPAEVIEALRRARTLAASSPADPSRGGAT